MSFLRRFFIRWLLPKRPLSEPDKARLAFLGMGDQLSNGELDRLTDAEVLERLNDLLVTSTRWAAVVTLTRERGEQWWLHRFMQTFGPPVSAISLSDGRRCFLTWAVG
jgi:hypothetical protein